VPMECSDGLVRTDIMYPDSYDCRDSSGSIDSVFSVWTCCVAPRFAVSGRRGYSTCRAEWRLNFAIAPPPMNSSLREF
jgi:hypothetical protein